MIKLNTHAIGLIKGDKHLWIKIQAALSITERTMYNYLDKNSEDLTKLSAVNELVSYTGLPLSELTDNGKLHKLLSK